MKTAVSKHFYFEKNFDHSKLRYRDPCNFLTKHALVSQQSTIVVAKDSNISQYLNVLINSPTFIILII